MRPLLRPERLHCLPGLLCCTSVFADLSVSCKAVVVVLLVAARCNLHTLGLTHACGAFVLRLAKHSCCSALRKAQDIYQQLEGHLQSLGLPVKSCGSDPVPVQRALVSGLFPHAARRQPDGAYKVIATGQAVHLHPSSVLRGKAPECVVFSELVRTTKQYAREVCRIQARWLPELAPAFFAAKAGAGVAAGVGGSKHNP